MTIVWHEQAPRESGQHKNLSNSSLGLAGLRTMLKVGKALCLQRANIPLQLIFISRLANRVTQYHAKIHLLRRPSIGGP